MNMSHFAKNNNGFTKTIVLASVIVSDKTTIVKIYKACCFKSCVSFCLGYYNLFNLTEKVYRNLNKACINSNIKSNFVRDFYTLETCSNCK